MNQKEQNIREYIALEDQCLKKLDLIRNGLLPYYGNITLKEAEEALWEQYIKFHKKIGELTHE